MSKRIKYKDIRRGKTAYMVSVGTITKITFQSRPYLAKPLCGRIILHVDYSYQDNPSFVDYFCCGDYGITDRYRYETNALFKTIKAAERFVELSKENCDKHLADCDRIFGDFISFTKDFTPTKIRLTSV